MARTDFFLDCAEMHIMYVLFSSFYHQLSIKPAGAFLPPVGNRALLSLYWGVQHKVSNCTVCKIVICAITRCILKFDHS